jgi:hypothetical protein
VVIGLSEVKLELSSCKEIIRILHEEIREINSSYQTTGNNANDDSTNKESHNPIASEDWTYHSSNQSRYPQLSRRNLRQLPLETSNQFAPLDNLNVDNEYPRYVTSLKCSQPLHDRQLKRRSVKQGANKPQNVKQKIEINRRQPY